MYPSDIMDIIIKIKDYEKKLEIFDKHIARFNESNLRTMLLYIEDDKMNDFIDRYIRYFNSSTITYIWTEAEYGWYPSLDSDLLLDRCIDLLEEEDILKIINTLLDKHANLRAVMLYLLSKTADEETIDNIYEAGASLGYIENTDSNEKKR